MKRSGVRYLTRQGFDNVWKNRMMAFASFCVLLVSLLLVGLSILFYINIQRGTKWVVGTRASHYVIF